MALKCAASRVVAAAVLGLLACAAAASGARVTMEADGVHGARRGWVKGHATPPSHELDLLFALRHRNVAVLESELYAVSTPSSPRYRQHLTFEQVRDLTSPPPAAVEAVSAFAKSHGASAVEVLPAGDFVRVVLTAENAAAMLQCSPFYTYTHPATAQVLHRTSSVYSLPSEVAEIVEFVGGVSRLPATGFRNHVRAAASSASTTEGNTPTIIAVGGGASETAFLAPKCLDGSVPTVTSPCGVTGALVTFTPAQSVGHVATSTNATCGSCSTFAGHQILATNFVQACTAMNKKSGLDQLYCSVEIENVTVGVDTSVSVVTTYSNGQSSGAATTATITQPFATPQSLKALYGVPSGVVAKAGGNTQAVVEFLGQYYSPADLRTYLTRFGLPVPDSIPVNGPNNASAPGLEASLDVQVITSIAETVPTQFWSTAGLRNNSAPASNTNQEPFLTWVTRLLSMDDASIPLVNSVSYDDDEDSMPHAFSDNLNVQFMKAGARGLSLLFCAGDDGVGGETVRAHGAASCPVFKPAFPAASPYALSIGASQLLHVPPNEAMLSEVASDSVTGSIVTGGGGFSNRYPAPQYQAAYVQHYLESESATLPPASYFNRSGRAYPDLSGIGTNYLIVIEDQWFQIGGTSASTPLVAAMVSLLNDKGMAAGKGPLGFLNPLVYSLGKAPFVNDITYGNNRCSAVPTNCCPYGFQAAEGFDPVTGLGSPAFAALYDLV